MRPLLLLVSWAAVANAVQEWFEIRGAPVAGEPFRVTIVGRNFSTESRVALTDDYGGCTNATRNETPAGAPAEPFAWTENDLTRWVVSYPPAVTASWSGASLFVCYRHTAEQSWEVLSTATKFLDRFYVYQVQPTYTIRPLVPSVPVSVTVTLLGLRLNPSAGGDVVLANTAESCTESPSAGNVVEGGSSPDYTVQYATEEVPEATHTLMGFRLTKDTREAFVCIRALSNHVYSAIPMDRSEATQPEQPGDSSLPPKMSFEVFRQELNFSEVFPRFNCEGPLVAGRQALCLLSLLLDDGSYLPSPPPASDFEVTYLTDGSGLEMCPLPQPELHNGSRSTVSVAFTPQHAGRLGRMRILYKGTPLPLQRPEDDFHGKQLEDFPGNVSGIPDPTLYRFFVDEPFGDAFDLGPEMVINGDVEDNSTDEFQGWQNESAAAGVGEGACCGGWTRRTTSPPPGWGLHYMAPVDGHNSRLLQAVSLSGDRSYRFSVRYFHYVNTSAPGYLASSMNADGKVTVVWKTGSGELRSELTILHTAPNEGVVEQVWDGRVGTYNETVRIPSPRWASFSDERKVPADAYEVLIILESDTTAGGVVLFDAVTLKTVSAVSAPQGEVDVLSNLYHSTAGHLWFSSERWLQGDPCTAHWQGVECRFFRVVSLRLPSNNLVGVLPDLSALELLEHVDLSNNHLIGSLIFSNSLRTLVAFDNSIGNYQDRLPWCLRRLDVSRNWLSAVPNGLWDSPYLEYVDLSRNRVEETAWNDNASDSYPAHRLKFGSNYGTGRSWPLRHVNLAHNSISGTLPDFVPADWRFLNNVDFSNNQINGTIPEGYAELPALKLLMLHNNLLTGSLPESLLVWEPQELVLSVKGNKLSGFLPSWVGRTRQADFRGNGFYCPLPEAAPGVFVGIAASSPIGVCDAGYD